MIKTKPSVIATAVLLSLGLSACGGGSSSGSDNSDDTPTVVNTAPTAVSLSTNNVEENAVAATIGVLSATDADSGDTFTYTVTDDRFEVSGSDLKLVEGQSFNYELTRSVDLEVTVTDSASNTFTQDLTVEITDSEGVESVLEGLSLPDTYAFDSKFEADSSSVSHTGQAARQILILELNEYIGSGLADDVAADAFASGAEAKTKLMSFYAKSELDWDTERDNGTDLVISAVEIEAPLTAKQTTITDISSSHKNLIGKIAGMDEVGQHKDWTTDLVGWNDTGSVTPDGVIEALFDQLVVNVQTEIDGTIRNDIAGNPITKLYINEDGTDIKQLVQKFLLGAVNFSQGTDDYLDNTVDGKGLLSVNTQDGTKTYSNLEHQFDEGFGYFGAAHNYNEYTDLEIKSDASYKDIDGDGEIDLASEINFSNSINAAKRDDGSVGNTNPTDFTQQAYDAFVTGRAIINAVAGEALSDDEMTTLLEQRDAAVLVWEKAISATIVHYINDTTADLDNIGNDDYSADNFADLAKHWSELKGFSLNLQFNPHSPMTDDQFVTMQEKIGMKPVTTVDDVEAYKTALLEVRTMLQEVYNFDEENVENW